MNVKKSNLKQKKVSLQNQFFEKKSNNIIRSYLLVNNYYTYKKK